MTPPYYHDDLVTLFHGDCIEVMRSLPDNSVHSIVTDPPYGLGFMGKEWDDLPPGLPWAVECLRVLKPGGHLLAFGGSRTWHRLAVAVEDAGFEIRDSIAWLYGSGFPKSLDVSKAIDRDAGATRKVIGKSHRHGGGTNKAVADYDRFAGPGAITVPATDAAREWDGWGTALKPAFEPIVVGRKPLIGTVAANVLEHGTGALNVEGCRIASGTRPLRVSDRRSGNEVYGDGLQGSRAVKGGTDAGRWPTNAVLDESQAAELDKQSGPLHTQDPATRYRPQDPAWSPSGIRRNAYRVRTQTTGGLREQGMGASRFFPTFRYEAKAPGSERPEVDGIQHPTVKPLDLMRWLVRLVTPPNGIVLEPFAGSGTTLEAALIEGFNVIGIEREADYLPLIMQRITKPLQQSLFGEIA